MEFLPIFLDIKGRKCVIIGGGVVAYRKARLLLRAGAFLHVVAEEVGAEIRKLCDDQLQSQIKISQDKFDEKYLGNAVLVIAATDDSDVNAQVCEAARLANIPVNVVDAPAQCSFIMPSIVDRSPVIIAISSSGSSPVLSRRLKELNETLVPNRMGRLAELLSEFRKPVKERIENFDERVRFWEWVLDSEIPELVYSGRDDLARRQLQAQLKSDKAESKGEVYLVGAGPGDPELLTLRALRLLYKADVVLYDRLVSAEILAKIRPDAEQIHVGKEASRHTVNQETINEMLVQFAKQGKRVLRLKGGDPFIFGRGGEELDSLAQAGIHFQVVPGITAASGCAAYAGIPLTHRDYSQSVRFLPGHLKQGELELDWEPLVKEQQTLVFYMGLVGLPKICSQLIKHGLSESKPVAVVQQGTTENQRVVVGQLSDIAEKVAAAKLQAPTLTIIGEVVMLRKNLSWFQDKRD